MTRFHEEMVLKGLLVIISICIASGPAFLLLTSPQVLLVEDRLRVDSFLTPYAMAIFFCAVLLFRKFSFFWIRAHLSVLPLVGLGFILFISSFVYTHGESISGFGVSYLGAILFFISAQGVMEEYPNTLKWVVYSYIATSIIVALLYLLLLSTPYVKVGSGRYFFLGENPNSYSTRMAISVILALFTFQGFSLKWRYAMLVLTVPQLFIIYLSGSRGAILMLAIALLLFLLSKQLSFGRRVGYSILITIFALGLSIYRSDHHSAEGDLIDRMVSLVEKGETAGRSDLWGQALEIFSDNPVLGVGEIGFTEEMLKRFNEPRDVHNLYLYLLTSSGVIGFCFFLGFILPLVLSCWRNRSQAPLGLGLMLAMLLFTLKSGGILSYSLMWFVFALISSLKKSIQWTRRNKH